MTTTATIYNIYKALRTFVNKHDLVRSFYINDDNNKIEDNAEYPLIEFTEVNTSIGRGVTDYNITICAFDDYVITDDLTSEQITENQMLAKANTELIIKDLYAFFFDRSTFNGKIFLNKTSTFNLTPLNTSTKDNVKGYELNITLRAINNGDYNTTPLKP